MYFLKWFFIVTGFSALIAGLNLQWLAVMEHTAIYLHYASRWYATGSLLLVFPPLVDFKLSETQPEKNFNRLLMALNVFLLIAALVALTNLAIELLILAFSGLTLLSIIYLKYWLGYLADIHLLQIVSPLQFIALHLQSVRGKLSPDYPLSFGILWLGIGFAFPGLIIGKLAMLLGSLTLLSFAFYGYKDSKASISLAWIILELVFTGYSLFFLGDAVFN